MSEYIENTISRQGTSFFLFFIYNRRGFTPCKYDSVYKKMQLGLGIQKRACMNLRVKIPACDFSTSKGG